MLLFFRLRSSHAAGRMSKPSEVIILAEDRRQQTFAYRYLLRLGIERQVIRPEPLPGNKGSGEQWVRLRYAKNVAAYRTRSATADTALVVVIDADTTPINRRTQQLNAVLAETRSVPRHPSEKIVHLIPKRHIETWILCLNGRNVDENKAYRKERGIDDQIKPSVETLYAWSRPGVVPSKRCVPSLYAAFPEVRKLER